MDATLISVSGQNFWLRKPAGETVNGWLASTCTAAWN
jgi:hypothetical protein